MGIRRLLITCVAVWVGGCPADAFGGLYHKDVLLAPDITPDGSAIPLDFDSFLTILTTMKKAHMPDTREAAAAQQRLAKLREKEPSQLSAAERVALAAELLRLTAGDGRPTAQADVKQAMNLLTPYKRQPPEGLEFLVYSLLAEGFFRDAETVVDAYPTAAAALIDYGFPKDMPGLSPAQRTWYEQLEKRYYLPFLRSRAEDARNSRGRQVNVLDPIFPARGKDAAKPVRFVGESGQYEVGRIAATEKAKIPPDAIAIVQQMILWHPTDGRLWWLLGELYNASGDIRSAERAMRTCKEEEVKYSNPEMREHYHAISEVNEITRGTAGGLSFALKLLPVELERIDATEEWHKKLAVGIGVGLVLAAVIYWQAREVARRVRARRLRVAYRS